MDSLTKKYKTNNFDSPLNVDVSKSCMLNFRLAGSKEMECGKNGGDENLKKNTQWGEC